MTIEVKTGRRCYCCGNDEAFIAIGKWREPSLTFSDLLSRQVCWECYVAVLHPVDRKLANAEKRLQEVYQGKRQITTGIRKDMRNIVAWKEAIENKKLQRQMFGIE